MQKTAYKIALYGSLLYVLLLLLSVFMSTQLTGFHEAGAHRESVCYWTDALVIFVECGDQVIVGELRAFFYNLWLLPYYAPIFGFGFPSPYYMSVSLITYAPLIFLGVVFIRWIIRRTRGGSPHTPSP